MGLVTLTSDLETGMRVASKVNFPSKFGHAGSLGSRIIRYVRDRRKDGRTDGQKQRLLPPSLRGREHNNWYKKNTERARLQGSH